jgi:hypothetical protein
LWFLSENVEMSVVFWKQFLMIFSVKNLYTVKPLIEPRPF